MKIRRILYLSYYIHKTESDIFSKFLKHASKESGKSKTSLFFDSLKAVFVYNISLLEYFQFKFYMNDKKKRGDWAGTGYMYEYQKNMNPKESRNILEDKILFNKRFNEFIKRDFTYLNEMENDPYRISSFLNNKSGMIVLKSSRGQAGKEIEIKPCDSFTPESLMNYMYEHKYDMAEEYIIQHSELKKLSASGINTIRIITQMEGGNILFLGARLRITINSHVDNMAAGNAAAPVDLNTGIVSGPGVFSDITKSDILIHPVSGCKIKGFKIPFWKETLNMVENAAKISDKNRSIGWDVAVTPSGPLLIEGNHNWCKLLWQLPVKEGLKKELECYK